MRIFGIILLENYCTVFVGISVTTQSMLLMTKEFKASLDLNNKSITATQGDQ